MSSVGRQNIGALMTYAVSALPFPAKLQVKPGRTENCIAGWVTTWV